MSWWFWYLFIGLMIIMLGTNSVVKDYGKDHSRLVHILGAITFVFIWAPAFVYVLLNKRK